MILTGDLFTDLDISCNQIFVDIVRKILTEVYPACRLKFCIDRCVDAFTNDNRSFTNMLQEHNINALHLNIPVYLNIPGVYSVTDTWRYFVEQYHVVLLLENDTQLAEVMSI